MNAEQIENTSSKIDLFSLFLCLVEKAISHLYG